MVVEWVMDIIGVFYGVLLWWFNGYLHGCSLRESNVAMKTKTFDRHGQKPPLRDDFACPVGLPEVNGDITIPDNDNSK